MGQTLRVLTVEKMLDFLRDLTKSAEEKRQEMLTAYVDGALSPRHISAFEQQLSQDPELQAEVEQMQQHKLMMRQLPRRRVPRNFTLDPALYSPPQRQPLLQLYPAMRVATVLTAVFLIIAVSAELLTPLRSAGFAATEAAAPIAMQDTVTESEAATEIIVEEEGAFVMAEEAVEELFEEEEMAEEPSAASAIEELSIEADMNTADAEMLAEEPEEMEEEEAEPLPEGAEPLSNDAATEIQIAATPAKAEVEVQITEQVADADDETAPAQTATSSSPRITETAVSERAIEAISPAATQVALVAPEIVPTASINMNDDEIAIAPPESPTIRQTVSTLRLVQIGLGLLLMLLLTAVYFTRRKL